MSSQWQIIDSRARQWLTKEYAENCNQLLFDNHRWCMETCGADHEMPHFFGDIELLNAPGSFCHTDGYTRKRRRIQKSLLVEQQLCNTHSYAECQLCNLPSPDFGCSGLPCTDMSRAGQQLKRHGRTNSVYITHGKFVESKRVPLFVIECTPESRHRVWIGRLGCHF